MLGWETTPIYPADDVRRLVTLADQIVQIMFDIPENVSKGSATHGVGCTRILFAKIG
jgi:hypothetical protein